MSKTFSETEKKYEICDQELLGIIERIETLYPEIRTHNSGLL
jgi:hypothetical protein